jgi:hypothetical protein
MVISYLSVHSCFVHGEIPIHEARDENEQSKVGVEQAARADENSQIVRKNRLSQRIQLQIWTSA